MGNVYLTVFLISALNVLTLQSVLDVYLDMPHKGIIASNALVLLLVPAVLLDLLILAYLAILDII